MKICLACSAGGHLTELSQLKELYEEHEHFFVTFKREDTKDLSGNENVHFITDPKRNPVKALKNAFQSFLVIFKERPDVVITTGAGVVIPLCYISKLFRSKVVYIESFCRTREPSLTGRLLYPISDLFLVQWVGLLRSFGKKARYFGGVF